jgi:hypothetical protein
MNDEKALFIWQRCSGFEAVQTAFGTFNGRDCIYLDEFHHGETTGTVTLRGEVSGQLCRPPLTEQWAAYSLQFFGVIACEHTDIDAWTWRSNSCFDRTIGSAWLASFGDAIAATHTHFLVQTYDDVYDIIAERFTFQPNSRNA